MSRHARGKSLFLGSFIHSKSLEELEFLHDTAVCVDDKGVVAAIEQIGKGLDQKKAEESIYPRLGWSVGDVSVHIAQPGQFFFPGFIGLSHSDLSLNLTDYV